MGVVDVSSDLPGISWGALPVAVPASNVSSAHFVLRFHPAAGSVLTSPAGATLGLASADATAVASFLASGPRGSNAWTMRLFLAAADVGSLAASSADALWLTTRDSCLATAHNASSAVGTDGSWAAEVAPLTYASGHATPRHRDLRAVGEWGSFVLLPPRSAHAGGALVLGAQGGLVSVPSPATSEWALVGWPASTPHEVTPTTAGVRVALRGRLRASGAAEGRCGAAALGDAIDAAVPAADRSALAAHAARGPTAPCASEYFDRASCAGAPSALGSDDALHCEWRGGKCNLVVGTQCPACVAGCTACTEGYCGSTCDSEYTFADTTAGNIDGLPVVCGTCVYVGGGL